MYRITLWLLLFIVCFASSGCSTASSLLLINYLDKDVRVWVENELIEPNLPAHSSRLIRAKYLTEMVRLRATVKGDIVVQESVFLKEKMLKKTEHDEIVVFEIKGE